MDPTYNECALQLHIHLLFPPSLWFFLGHLVVVTSAQDLLKDTKKAHLETAGIEVGKRKMRGVSPNTYCPPPLSTGPSPLHHPPQEALRLMTTIPKEANNIICLSMLVGVSRSQLLSHGSLWAQEGLLFWDMRSPKGVKGEQRHVFLLDHRIIIALPSDSEGCFMFELGIKVGGLYTE